MKKGTTPPRFVFQALSGGGDQVFTMAETNTAPRFIQAAKLSSRHIVSKAEKDARREKRLCFAYGRMRAVNAILAFDHRGPCRTDDGPVYFDLMLPYAVEVSELRPEANIDGAWRRMRYWLPGLCAEMGRQGFDAQWDALSDLRSLVKARHRVESELGHIDWLPTAERITRETRLTRERRAAINAMYPDRPPIRGIGVIDPLTEAEKREANKLRMRATRLANKVIPQWMRTKGKDDAAIAAVIGCSPKKIQRKRLGGTLDAFLADQGPDVLKVCMPYILENRDAQIQDTDHELDALPPDTHAEAMAILSEILADPYAAELEAIW